MTNRSGTGTNSSFFCRGLRIALLLVLAMPAHAQEAQPIPTTSAVSLTLKRAIELALQNSKDIQIAKLQARLADRSAMITKAQFLPNLYAGSGAGYTFGIPETPGGRAPALFDVTYTEQVFNEPLRGQGKEQQEQAKSQKILLEDARNGVIVRTASTYLELSMVRHSLVLLRKEQESADKILAVTQQREKENFELPVVVTKDQLTKARVVQRVFQLEGREDELEVVLRGQTGLAENTLIEVTPEDLPGVAEQEGANLVALALQDNVALRVAQSDVRAKEFRLTGEKRGYYPTLQLFSVYSLLAKFNNYDQFFKTFERNNFSLRERDAAKEVARLELQLAQQNLTVLQSQFGEGRLNLREVEKARLEENDKWMAYLDANFQRQQAQLDLLQTAGQLDKVWQ